MSNRLHQRLIVEAHSDQRPVTEALYLLLGWNQMLLLMSPERGFLSCTEVAEFTLVRPESRVSDVVLFQHMAMLEGAATHLAGVLLVALAAWAVLLWGEWRHSRQAEAEGIG